MLESILPPQRQTKQMDTLQLIKSHKPSLGCNSSKDEVMANKLLALVPVLQSMQEHLIPWSISSLDALVLSGHSPEHPHRAKQRRSHQGLGLL